MEYRILPHGSEKISVLGFDSGSLTTTEKKIEDVIRAAIQNGINYFDMALPFHVKQEKRMREMADYFKELRGKQI